MSRTAESESSPQLRALQGTLTETTERLAAELAHPGPQAPAWSDQQWRVARAVAAIHGVSGLLSAGLRWRGPHGWNGFLAQQHSHIARRMANINALLERLDAEARRAGLALLVLKGAALHARGLYVAGERPMADIDILVREQEAGPAADLLAGLGYREGPSTWKHRSFEPRVAEGAVPSLGEDAAAPIKLEMHTRVREILPVRAVEISRQVTPAQLRAGLNDYPSTAALLLHVLLHAAGAMVLRELRLLHLHDIARLCAVMSGRDWEELFELGGVTEDPTLWWAYPPCVLANRYFACVPQRVVARLARFCPGALRRRYRHRRLTDVSISHLWVSAFPGIEWSRSAGERAHYIARRLVPSRATLALREEFAIAQPNVSGGDWARTSQLQRVLRWMLAGQARQATLQTVRASLAIPP